MKKTFFLISVLLITNVFGQQNNFKVKGVIVDQSSQEPIPFATVLLVDKGTQKAITGTTTSEEGYFAITSASKEIYVEISFIGY